MKMLMKRGVALLMALILIVGFVPATIFTANAATVDYKYAGSYIYNWGTREEVANFLSPNAEAFYDENNVSYYELAALSGSASESSVPSSALYSRLYQIMDTAHSYEIGYNATRDLYQYTDCEANGNVISSFYSGNPIGPDWDSGETWNREHTWPNSKGGDADNGTPNETDIMMLRPAAVSENGSRSNKAYGENSGYYDPNTESNGTHNLHGDVARIMLYVYVRWGAEYSILQTNMWGIDGVIESKELLLEWMEEDPVDTWEMGRNDSVESITGTRNIFVDYPELAFALFEEEVPAAMQTPSGMAAASSYTVTAKSGNDAQGTVSVSGNVITATPKEGYVVSGYKVTSGTATVSQNGNTFTVYPTTDCTVQINFAARTQVTVSFSGATGVANQTVYAGESIELPDVTNAPDGYTFLGWMEAELTEDTTEEPTFHTGTYTPVTSVTLYALYSYESGGGESGYVLTDLADIKSTDTVVVTMTKGSTVYALSNNNGTSSAPAATTVTVKTENGVSKLSSEPADALKWNIGGSENAYIFYVAGSTEEWLYCTNNNNGVRVGTNSSNTFKINSNYLYHIGQGRYLGVYTTNPDWRSYTSINTNISGQTLGFYVKGEGGATYYTGDSIKCEHVNQSVIPAVPATCTEGGFTAGVQCDDCSSVLTTPEAVDALGHNYVDGACENCGEEQPVAVVTVDRTYIFSDYAAGTQYAKNEEHVLDEDVTMVTNDCHFTEQLRIYSSSTNNGHAEIHSDLPIAGLKFNAGNNADSVVVYGSNDGGNTWTEIATQAVTSTYTDYTVNFGGNTYTSLKLDVAGTKQVRLKNITLTLVTENSGSEEPPCEHVNRVPVGDAVDATCTETGMTAGEKCAECDVVITQQEVIPALGHDYELEEITYTCSRCGDHFDTFYIHFSVPSGVEAVADKVYKLEGINLPSADVPTNGNYEYTFVGWTTAQMDDSVDAPQQIWKADDKFEASAEQTLYAVYSYTVAGVGEASYVLTELVNIKPTDSVVITATKSDGKTYAMSNDKGTSSGPAPTLVTVSGTQLANAPADTIKWTVTYDQNGYMFFPEGNDAKWLYCNSSNDGVRVGTGNNKYFEIDATSGYLKNKAVNRYLGVYNTQDWRCYTAPTATNIANQTLKFFVKQSGSTLYYTTNVAAADCEHEWDSGKITAEATCTTVGVMTYTCTICEDTKTEEIPEKEHAYASVVTPATCTTAGYTTFTCSACGDSYIGDNVDPLGHNYVDGVCERCGVKEPVARYELVTNLSEIRSGGQFVIVAVSNDTYYALGKTLTSGKLNAVVLDASGNLIYTENAPTWIISASGEKILLNDGESYLKHSSGTNMSTLKNEAFEWTIAAAEAENAFNIKSSSDSTRAITYRASTFNLYGTYAFSNNNNGEYFADLYFFRCIHKWTEATCTAPKTCSVCGATDGEALGHTDETIPAVEATNDTHGWTEGARCTVCGEVLTAPTRIPCLVGTMESWNITLKENIGVNFHLFVNKSIREDAQISITFYGKTETIAVSQCTYDEEKDVYNVTVDAAAAQMMDDIIVRITDGTGNTVERTRTIRQYADYILDPENDYDEETKTVVREMLNYGAKAQEYFNYNNEAEEDLANTGIDGFGAQAVPETADQEKSVTGETEGITFYGATLVFRNKIALRYYFEPEDVNGEYSFTVNGETYTPQKKQGLLYIEIPGITPDRLDEQFPVSVKTADDQGTLTVSYGPMNYLVNMNVKGSDNLKALVKALYNYHLAAEALTQE